jgi:hypothetical protein
MRPSFLDREFINCNRLWLFEPLVVEETQGSPMAKNRKIGTVEKSVQRHAKEITAVEQYWRTAGQPKSRKLPKNYYYIDELAHPQFELIKL